MEALLLDLLKNFGLPVALVVGAYIFAVKQFWPYYVSVSEARQKADREDRASLVAAVKEANASNAQLVRVVDSLDATLKRLNSDMSQGFARLDEDVGAIFTELRKERPSARARQQEQKQSNE